MTRTDCIIAAVFYLAIALMLPAAILFRAVS
jgi:hypothetical protein